MPSDKRFPRIPDAVFDRIEELAGKERSDEEDDELRRLQNQVAAQNDENYYHYVKSNKSTGFRNAQKE